MDLTQNICHNTDKVTLIFTKSIIIQSDFIGSVIFHCDLGFLFLFFSLDGLWIGISGRNSRTLKESFTLTEEMLVIVFLFYYEELPIGQPADQSAGRRTYRL